MPAESQQSLDMRMESIEAFARIIKDKRKDAIDGRLASGVEATWQECEDAYEGRDKYNNKRKAFTKSRSQNGGLTETKAPVGRSTVIPNITRPYCDAAAARVADMLLPTDDRNWAIQSTPDPKMVRSLTNASQAMGMDGQPMFKQAAGVAQQQGMLSRIAGLFNANQPGQAQQAVSVGELAQQNIDAAKEAAERAQGVIDDWLVECRYHTEVRKVIETCARLGVGILKGPYPQKKTSRAASKTPDGWTMIIEISTNPVSTCVSPWNFYPDPNCGEDIQKGSYCFERDDITTRGLKDLKGGDYIDEMIDLCIEEGPINSQDGVRRLKDNEKLSDKDLFEIWYYQGSVSKKDMEAANCQCEKDDAPCIITMVNNRIIKITMSPLDSGEFPYDLMPWQSRVGSWDGIGVAEQIMTCQRGLTGAVRAMMDNASISSGPQIIIDSSLIEPADGRWAITPNKLWRKKLNAEAMDDVRKAFTIVNIETLQQELLNIINYWTKAAENVTQLPMLLQGQEDQGEVAKTLGETQIRNNNGSTVLRRITRTFDDKITEPHIGRYYEWLLLHGPEDAKGDFQIDALGSTALVERDTQSAALAELRKDSLEPAYEVDPAKVMKESLKAMRLDPKSVLLDDEQKKAAAQRQQPEDPRITAARIMAQGKQQSEQSQQQFDASEAEKDRQLQLVVEQVNERIESMKEGTKQEISMNDLKGMLAATSMKLNVTAKLNNDDNTLELHKHHNPAPVMPPVIQTPGRAADGHAFEQSNNGVQTLANGGEITGAGTTTSDSVPIMASKDEGVLNAEAMSLLGKERLNHMNEMGLQLRNAQHLADGGIVDGVVQAIKDKWAQLQKDMVPEPFQRVGDALDGKTPQPPTPPPTDDKKGQ